MLSSSVTAITSASTVKPSSESIIPMDAASSAATKIELSLDDIFLKASEKLSAVTAEVEKSFNKFVTKGEINGTPVEIAKKVEAAFNVNIDPNKSAFGTNLLSTRGAVLNEGEIFVGVCNGVYEIRARQEANKFFVAAKYPFKVGYTTEELQRVHINDLLIGGNGRYIINVPFGKYALTVGTQNERKIYGPGVHVIHDPNFVYDPRNDLIDQNQLYINRGIMHIIRVAPGKMAKVTINGKPRLLLPQEDPYIFFNANFKQFDPAIDYADINENYIHHGQIHIIRVPVGKIAKIKINGTPHLLAAQKDPYVFDDATFQQFNPETDYCNVNDLYIQHGQIHVLRVPSNWLAKITINGLPQLLKAQPDPYVFCDPNFQQFKTAEHYCKTNDNCIQHGNILIVRVPAGKVLKIWDNGEPVLLEHRKDPYKYSDPNVYLAGKSYQDSLVDATEALVIHGSIKRIITNTGFKTPIYEAGKLRILLPTDKPVKIQDESCRVGKPIPDAVQNMYIPSKKDEWLSVSTNDSLQINIQLAVAYQIVDPEKALPGLGEDKIELHIQNQAIAFMTSEIKRHSSTDFLRNNKRPDESHNPGELAIATTDQQEHVLKQLQTALQDYGLKITQLSIERTEYPDREIAKEMGQQSLVSAKTAGEVAVLNQKSQLLQADARNKAQQASIALEQANSAKIATAQANLAEAKLHAEAKKATAEGEGEAESLRSTGMAKAKQIAKTTEIETLAELQVHQTSIMRSEASREAEMKMIALEQQNKAKLETSKFDLEVARIELEKARVNFEKTKLEAEAVKVMGEANAGAESLRLTAMAEAFSINPQLAAYLSTQQIALAITKAQGLTLTSPELVQLLMPLGLSGNPATLFSQTNRNVSPLRVLDAQADIAAERKLK